MFERIAARANEERLQLFGISQRLSVAASQVEFVKTLSNKATRVLSAPRYPLPGIERNFFFFFFLKLAFSADGKTFAPLHSTAAQQQPLHTKFYLQNSALQSADMMRSSEVRSLAIEAVASDRQKGQNVEREGLGRLPDNLDSVSSLLLFNSNDNPYKAYRSLDNLTGAGMMHVALLLCFTLLMMCSRAETAERARKGRQNACRRARNSSGRTAAAQLCRRTSRVEIFSLFDGFLFYQLF